VGLLSEMRRWRLSRGCRWSGVFRCVPAFLCPASEANGHARRRRPPSVLNSVWQMVRGGSGQRAVGGYLPGTGVPAANKQRKRPGRNVDRGSQEDGNIETSGKKVARLVDESEPSTETPRHAASSGFKAPGVQWSALVPPT